MLERIRKLKDKKGFTLVELIVVLVILAILAALLVPALTGYIDRANKQAIVAETRSAVMAAQTIADEQYAKGTAVDSWTDKSTNLTDAKNLAEVDGDIISVTFASKSSKIETLTYKNGTKSCTYHATADNKYEDGHYQIPAASVSGEGQ